MEKHKHNKSHTDKPGTQDENMPSQRFEDSPLGSNISEAAELPSPDNINELHDQIATLSKALQEAQEKVDSHWDRLLRKEAEFQNVQKRAQEDIEKARKFAIERFAAEVLAVVDSIEQGLVFAENGKASVEDLTQGMKLTHTVLLNALDKQGIQPVDPKQGDAFNPAYHEAISIQETSDVPPNRVMAVVQKGYMLNERLLRPARVVVSRAPASNAG
ncbi:MAG: nucleotide exchange factor GrpE [Gammaproteobacteria bacterium 39-13]|nr:nucleotide exchange factor GrpE [Gammaproteobacteria bacterium]OJV91391.1 MAG: nucleotide exchange factor GrpE [Gammaproteobacteria bacterium 39-13]